MQGYTPLSRGVGPWLNNLVLPAITLGGVYIALIARITRATMLEVLSQDYVRTARAKGVGNTTILFLHALKNAAVPIVTVIGIGVALLIGGAVVTESVFAIPGLGRRGGRCHPAARLPDHPGRGPAVLVRLRARQLGGRPGVYRGRSEDPVLSLTVEAPIAAALKPHVTPAPVLPDVLPPVKQRGRVMTIVRRYPTMVIGGVLLFLILFCALAAPWLWTVDPTALAPARRTRVPSAQYWFGTDALGRDIYSRVLYGSRVSLIVGFSVAILASAVGMAIGLVSGFVRWAGWAGDADHGRADVDPTDPAGDRADGADPRQRRQCRPCDHGRGNPARFQARARRRAQLT